MGEFFLAQMIQEQESSFTLNAILTTLCRNQIIGSKRQTLSCKFETDLQAEELGEFFLLLLLYYSQA